MKPHTAASRFAFAYAFLAVLAVAFMESPTMAGEIYAPPPPLDAGFSLAGGPDELPDFKPDEIIVKFDPNVLPAEKLRIASDYGCQLGQSCSVGNLQLVRLPEAANVQQMAEAFELRDDVEYAEPNPYARILFVPDDSYYSYQWNLDNAETRGIHMEDAWNIVQGDPSVVVAILDTGVAYEDFGVYRLAPDLAGTLFAAGYDFANNDDHPNDDQGHGTHVAGTIAQSTNNGMGVAGVAFGCTIMPIKVLDTDGVGDHFTIARGIRYAVDHGARVINLSLGSNKSSRTLRDAVKFAYNREVTVVCAAGNAYLKGNTPSYPAAETTYLIAVGAVRYDSTRAPYSNTGTYLSVVAPGGDTSIDQNKDGYVDGILQQTFRSEPGAFAYWFFQGTSMAAPHVSGLAALLASQGVTHPDKIKKAIEMTTRDLGPEGWDSEYGWGIIDAAAALAYYGPADVIQAAAGAERR